MNPILENLRQHLPDYLTRQQVGEYLKDFISPKYLANLDSKGVGPKRYKIGRKNVYAKEDMLNFLDERITPVADSQ